MIGKNSVIEALPTRKNKVKVYPFLWKNCSTGMKAKIEAHTDYKEIKDDAVE
jgi:hypothetical protein